MKMTGLWKKKQQEITMLHPLYLCMYSAAENACKERHVCCTRTCYHVAPEERLSYSLYGYDRKENKVEILC